MSLTDLLNPTGHGPFILASFGISFIVLLWNIVVPLVQGRRVRRQIRNELQARRQVS